MIRRADGATPHLAFNAAVGILRHATKFVQFVRHAGDVVRGAYLFLPTIFRDERNGLLTLLFGAKGLATLARVYAWTHVPAASQKSRSITSFANCSASLFSWPRSDTAKAVTTVDLVAVFVVKGRGLFGIGDPVESAKDLGL